MIPEGRIRSVCCLLKNVLERALVRVYYLLKYVLERALVRVYYSSSGFCLRVQNVFCNIFIIIIISNYTNSVAYEGVCLWVGGKQGAVSIKII